ncbi:MFS general substrate transporter [Aspergillus affinis]|uniref:MFS general substrate transporter n=1 Tax=Aspergillus affinis TaxID=1070780 RepID=UPI0022FF1E00|nr:MFS general substrate transporter [Aspergillus affinis]KAI9036876.1 MFS general substrate transporter [Aspergillus affinis]
MGDGEGNTNVEHTAKSEPAEVAVDVESSQTDSDPPAQYLTSLRLHLVTAAITSDIGGQDKVYWIIASYMIGYVGVLVISAKFSDIFGRKSCLLAAVLIFIVFSGACGGSQTIEQLIVFRAFQGVGGAGNYSLCAAVVLELVPPEKYASYTSGMSVVCAISLLLGPIFGGAISESAWRWVFLLNVPPAALAGLVLIFTLPNRFPRHNQPKNATHFSIRQSLTDTFRKVDLLGSCLLLIATVCLVAPLEEANREFAWRSAFTIVMLVISGLAWIIFLLWERRVTQSSGPTEPVFPWRFVQNRVWMGMLLNSICLGGTWFVAIFQLPQRFQFVNGLSPLQAGIRFIPFTVAAPVGSVLAPVVAKIFKIPLVYLVLVASLIQMVAYALLGTLSESVHMAAAQYGYQVLAGFGCGINITLLILMTPFTVEERDKAVAMGAVAQFRVMGGAICLAIVTAASQGYLQSHLSNLLDPQQVHDILNSTDALGEFSAVTQEAIRKTYSGRYNLQMKILIELAGGQVLSTTLMWKKKQLTV